MTLNTMKNILEMMILIFDVNLYYQKLNFQFNLILLFIMLLDYLQKEC